MEKTFTFHVHLPKYVEKYGIPIVLGNVKELGLWKNPIVRLSRPFPQNPTYWQSNPITISLLNFGIQYKFAVFLTPISPGETKVAFEGFSIKDSRTLDILRNEQFGIWKSNEFLLLSNTLDDFAFVDCIYNTITVNNLKDKIMEYQHLLTIYNDFMIRASNLEFIVNRIDDSSREQRLFICLLLG
ncbi:1063_t:CDS:1, partial [Funneliformis geosporum]